MAWTATKRKGRINGLTVVEFHGFAGDLLRFGVRVPEQLAAATWGGSIKTRPEVADVAGTFAVDTTADPVDGTVRLVVSAETRGLTVGEDYHADLWYLPASDPEPTTVLYAHIHPVRRVSPQPET